MADPVYSDTQPHAKVVWGTIGGALAVLITSLLRHYTSLDLSPDETASLAIVCSAVIGYLTPHAGFTGKGL